MKSLFLVMGLICVSGYTQKETLTVFGVGAINSIVITSDEVFKIKISTSSGKHISIRTKADGEYFNDIGLGNIEVQTKDAEIKANSRHGLVKNIIDSPGDNIIELSSINGNIRVEKTKKY